MLAQFSVPSHAQIAEDELCGILHHMVKHDGHNALCKLGRIPTGMSLEDFISYFGQINYSKA
eukprot:5979683-Ditylum_brightwellii.AAC.1